MQFRARDNVPALTAVLSVVSLGLVFAAVRRALPTALLPHPPAGVLAAVPHANAAISAAAVVTILAGWRWIRRGEVRKHRAAMLAAFALFAAFLGLYLYRMALEGPAEFPGSGLAELAFLVLMGVHVLLAMVCVPLLYYVLLLAVTRSIPDLRRSADARVGRLAATLWLVSFALGLIVYGWLYWVY